MDKDMDKHERIRVNDMSTIRIGDWAIAEVYRPYNNSRTHIHGEIVDIKYPIFRVKYEYCRFIDFLFEDVDRTVFVGEDRIERFEHRDKYAKMIKLEKIKKDKQYLIPVKNHGRSQAWEMISEYLKISEVPKEEVDLTNEEMLRRAWRLREELNKLQDENPKQEEPKEKCELCNLNSNNAWMVHTCKPLKKTFSPKYCPLCGRKLI